MLFLRLGDRQELQAYDCEFLVTEGLTVRTGLSDNVSEG